jgi:lipopolysaccharide transport system ATP-binding protein
MERLLKPIIQVRGLGKRFRIGERRTPYGSLRDSLSRMARSPLAALRRLRDEHPTIWALREVSFDVMPGEVVGVIGRNGAGKSTLLKILTRITAPTEGSADLYGRVASLLEVGTGFHAELTGRDNIFLNGAILGMRRAEIAAKFDEIVAFAEIDEFIDTPVKHYSSGMFVRLAFAVAAHLEPEILLVDEVLAVGDAEFQKKCLGKMGEVARGGRTVLFVSHNMAAVQKLCPRGLLLANGRLVLAGGVDVIVDGYLAESSAAVTSAWAVPQAPPGAPATVVRLELFDGLGQPRSHFRLFEPWHARITFRVHSPISNLVCGLGVQSCRHGPVATSWSEPAGLAPGDYEARLSWRGPALCAGTYQFAVGLSVGARSLHYADAQGFLTVQDATAERHPVSSVSGVVLPDETLRIERLPDPTVTGPGALACSS